jgi:predicted glycosyltransferase
MKVWIDISNAPHVHFFKHLIKKIKADVIVTTRAFDSVPQILELNNIRYTIIGNHGGSDVKEKLLASSKRILELTEFIADQEVDLAIFKHSVEAPRVAYGLQIPSICVMDNEHGVAQNKLMLPLSTKVIAPTCIPAEEIMQFGVKKEDLIQFHGICELAHIRDFKPDKRVMHQLGLNLDKTIVIMRPEPAKANYFNGDRKKTIIKKILENNTFDQCVVFPRFEEQEKVLQFPHTVIPDKAVDTLSLMYYADLVISAGGSMNREAICVGTPAISTYPEKLLSVTKFLIGLGLKKHSLDIPEIFSYAKRLMADTEYRERASQILKKMEDPVDVLSREIHTFDNEGFN